MKPLILHPGNVTLHELSLLYYAGRPAKLSRKCKSAVEVAAKKVAVAASGNDAVYGVNTGFGKLAHIKIPEHDTAKLQRNLILSHCAGVGNPMDSRVARLMMALKLISLGRGASGVRWQLIQLLEGMLAKGVTPIVPEQGSVGASGDLAPLAHMAAVMIGEGEAELNGKVMSGRKALSSAGLKPILLGPKEGLALINGTQFSTAFALAGLFEAWNCSQNAIIAAVVTSAIM